MVLFYSACLSVKGIMPINVPLSAVSVSAPDIHPHSALAHILFLSLAHLPSLSGSLIFSQHHQTPCPKIYSLGHLFLSNHLPRSLFNWLPISEKATFSPHHLHLPLTYSLPDPKIQVLAPLCPLRCSRGHPIEMGCQPHMECKTF